MKNRELVEVVTASFASLWDQETARQSDHKWVGGPDIEAHKCVKCGLLLWDKIHVIPRQAN